jgi:branched-subunit amino acid transport protein
MEGALKLWTVIVAVGLLNFVSRLSFIAWFARRSMPSVLARALRYVPAAMLTALIVPMIVLPGSDGGALDPKVVAALVAGAVAFATRSTPRTIAGGMTALWLLQWMASEFG